MSREPILPAHERAAHRPWIEGRSITELVSLLPPGRPQPLGIAVRIVVQACSEIEAMHELSGPDGYLLGESIVAPEVARGDDIDASADVFSLGALLYLLTTGHSPTLALRGFERSFTADTDAWTLPTRAILDRYPRGLRDVVLRALSLQHDDRFPTAAEMGLALATAFPGYASEDELRAFLEQLDAPDSVAPSQVPAGSHGSTSAEARVALGTLVIAFGVAFGVTLALSSGQWTRRVAAAPAVAARPPIAAPPIAAPALTAPPIQVSSPTAVPEPSATAPDPPRRFRRARPAASARPATPHADAVARRYGI